MVTAKYEAKENAHILFTFGRKNYRRFGNGLLDFDGHGAFSPDGKWMTTETYSTKVLHEQKLYLMDMKTETVLPLGRYLHPPEFREKTPSAICTRAGVQREISLISIQYLPAAGRHIF